MLSRIHWIIETYARRPLVLAFFALGAVGLMAHYFVSGLPPSRYRTTNYPSFPRANLAISSKATLEAIRRAGKQSEVDAIDLGQLWMNTAPKTQLWDEAQKRNTNYINTAPDEKFYQVLDEFPNLRQVLGVYGFPVDARHFARLSNLEYLMLHGTEVSHLDALKTLTNLKRLDYDVIKPPVGFEALQELPKLKMIVFTIRNAVGDDLLKTVARFPYLHTLVLSFSNRLPPNWPKDRKFESGDPPLSEAGFEAVAGAPALETLYVGGYAPRNEDTLLNLARKCRAAVYPAFVNKERIPLSALGLVPAILFSIPIGIQLASQFQSPMRRLAPRFTSSHSYVGFGLSVGVAVLTAFSLARNGINILVAILVSISLVASVIAVAATARQGDFQPSSAVKWLRIAWGPCLLAIIFYPNLDDRALVEGSPLITALTGLAAAVSIANACLTLNLLVFARPASGSAWQWPNTKNASFGGHYRKNWVFATAAAESGIERLPPKANGESWWRQVARLRAGNPPLRPARFALAMGAIMLAFPFLFRWIWDLGAQPSFTYSTIVGNSFMVLMATTFQVVTLWRARIMVLPLELTRPYSRASLQTGMSLAFLVDLLPVAALVAVMQAVAVNWNADSPLRWGSMPFDFAVWFAMDFAMSAGIGAMAVVIHRLWLGATLAILIGQACAVGTMTLVMLRIGFRTFNASLMTAEAAEAQFWLPILVGIGLAWWMHRRWLGLEIGRRT